MENSNPNKDFIDDLLTEILIRVPVKDVHCYKLVSKRWLQLISSPIFAKQYTLHNHKPNHKQIMISSIFPTESGIRTRFGVVYFGFKFIRKPFYLKFPISFDGRKQIIGEDDDIECSSNGLILFSRHFYGEIEFYYIINPLTHKLFVIPKSPIEEGKNRLCAGLIYDNFIDSKCKVVLFSKIRELLQISCFCSQTMNWSIFYVAFSKCYEWIGYRKLVSLNRMLYGLCDSGVLIYDPYNKPDELKVIGLPEKINIDERTIEVFEGKIGLCMSKKLWESIRVWELENCTWHLKYDIDLTKMKEGDSRIAGSLINFGKMDDDTIYLCSFNGIFSLNLKTKVLTILLHAFINNAHSSESPSWPTPVPCAKCDTTHKRVIGSMNQNKTLGESSTPSVLHRQGWSWGKIVSKFLCR